MITGDRQLGVMYRDLIIKQIEIELKPSKERVQRMKDRLIMHHLMSWKDCMSLLKDSEYRR